MATITRFEDIEAWQLGRELKRSLYQCSKIGEFVQFLSHSKGSCGEVQDHLYTALDQSYLTQEQFDELYRKASEVGQKLGAFMNYLQRTEIRGRKFRQLET